MNSEAAQMAGPVDAQTQGSAYVIPDADFRARFGSCATRSYDFNTKTLTIDFGPTNYLCANGRYRRGKILVRFTTDVNRRTVGAVVTRVDYFVNDNQHTAARTDTGSFTVDVTNTNSKAMTLDYGTGTCDNGAIVTVNSRPRTVSLRQHQDLAFG